MSLLGAQGWAAAAASTAFFAALCLTVPIARLPGARAMEYQSDRAWGLLLLVTLPSVFIASTLPAILIAILAFTQVRTRWPQLVAGADDHASGPLDRTNRLGALILTLAVIAASSVGINAMHLSTDDLRGLQQQERTAFPGATEGPTIDAPQP